MPPPYMSHDQLTGPCLESREILHNDYIRQVPRIMGCIHHLLIETVPAFDDHPGEADQCVCNLVQPVTLVVQSLDLVVR